MIHKHEFKNRIEALELALVNAKEALEFCCMPITSTNYSKNLIESFKNDRKRAEKEIKEINKILNWSE